MFCDDKEEFGTVMYVQKNKGGKQRNSNVFDSLSEGEERKEGLEEN